jgi:NAD(P)-dependent dehydrogenase (short-subunit alcohol dehydrogenase family)
MELRGKTALITGGARRIGSEVALGLAREGADIVVQYRSSSADAAALRDSIAGLGVRCYLVRADLGKPGGCAALIRGAVAKAGRIDALVNNASVFRPMGFGEADFESVAANVRVNAWAPFELGRLFAERFKTGRIINMLDTKVSGYNFGSFPYYLSKKMLETLTMSMALKLAPGITVNAVAPGLILPPEGRSDAYLETLKNGVPLRRRGYPKDVADAIVFLLRSDFITGQVVYVDGGEHLNPMVTGL